MSWTIPEIVSKKGKERIVSLTAYDFQIASMLDEAGVDILLVGDSMGNVVYGQPNTLSVTVDDIVRHTQAVSRAAKNALVVSDLPFGSYQPSIEIAVLSATRCLGQGGAHAVKLEGGAPMAETIKRLVDVGIPVMGHVGLTPQSVNQQGGYRMVGKSSEEADRIFNDAQAVERAGAFSIVLECVESDVAAKITNALHIPTIGIGSGNSCDGEILVSNDLFGITVGHIPKFVTPLANVRTIVTEAAKTFVTSTKRQK